MTNVTYSDRIKHTIETAQERLLENKSSIKTYKTQQTAVTAANSLAADILGYWQVDEVTVEVLMLDNGRYFVAADMADVLSRAETGGYVFPHMDGYWTITPARYIIEGPRDGIFEGGLFY